MEHELRILLLEDSAADAEMVQRELRRGGLSFTARRVETREAFAEQLEEFKPDLVISDYMLPSFDGLTALALARENLPDVPFILASSYIGEERTAQALRSGATDFLLKANLSTRLVPAVQRAMREVAEHAERRKTEEMLRQAQKLEAVGQLTAGIAHDFNNILMVILSNVDSLQDEVGVDMPLAHRLDEIGRAVQRAADLTRSLLAFSRKQPLRPERTALNDLVAATGSLLRRTLGERIEIDANLADDLWAVNIDRAQLETALVNLCVNARDAMPHGGRLLIETGNVTLDGDHVALYPDVAGGDYAMLAVTDTGSGIPSDVLARVFEPFFTTKEFGKGTGLGLSMVYGFIKQSSGHVVIHSEVGWGTTIKLYLPRSDGAPEDVVVGRSLPTPVGTERILVVEDDRPVRAGIARQLRSLGYAVDEAPDGAAGVAVFQAASQPYDLLLTDVVMPGPLSGRALADEVTRRWPKTRVVFMSGYTRDGIGRDGRLDADVPLLSKPFRKADLAQVVRQALDGADGSGGSAA